ncbi:uncharacterized protein KY384_004766 [Bacidia gigantensis]|uniref:uncharacterized protein n=1 Tax=Bacidia gigantensis TaxID=2732470 RepID=UPI001D047986|nr:uncharacterized protein KY384_004766 [Bacidia gigantensis]KAG8530265.1 hypothetical protein KY384_004766 [Bacidia gigantensis]
MLPGFNLPFGSIFPPSVVDWTSSPGSNSSNGNEDLIMQLKQQFGARVAEMQTMVEKANESVKSAVGERDAATARADKAELDGKAQQAELASLKLELEACKQSVQQYWVAVTAAATKLEQVSNEAASTKAELTRYLMEMEASRRDLELQKATNQTLTAQLDSSAKELASVKVEFSSFKVQADIQAETNGKAQELAKQTIANLTEEVSRSTTSLHQARSASEASRLELERANGQLTQLKRECESWKVSASQEAEKNVRTTQSMQEEIRRGESERRSLQDGLNRSQNELEMARRVLADVERRFRDMSSPGNIFKSLF